MPHSPFSRHALAGAWCRRDAWTCDRTTPATRERSGRGPARPAPACGFTAFQRYRLAALLEGGTELLLWGKWTSRLPVPSVRTVISERRPNQRAGGRGSGEGSRCCTLDARDSTSTPGLAESQRSQRSRRAVGAATTDSARRGGAEETSRTTTEISEPQREQTSAGSSRASNGVVDATRGATEVSAASLRAAFRAVA